MIQLKQYNLIIDKFMTYSLDFRKKVLAIKSQVA